MQSVKILLRIKSGRVLNPAYWRWLSLSQCSLKNKSEDGNEEGKKLKSTKNTAAVEKLNSLLKSMVEEDSHSESKCVPKVNIATPQKKFRKNQQTESREKSEIEKSAKLVAESLGGDVLKTESDLLQKLLEQSSPAEKSTVQLSDLIVGMKIDRSKKDQDSGIGEEGRAQQVRRILGGRTRSPSSGVPSKVYKEEIRPSMLATPVNLFGASPLGLLEVVKGDKPEHLSTWEQLQERELRLAVTHPPDNVWEEMVLWTKQGRLWKFPINNEQGLEEEAKYFFADHVFLEHHLEPWCPKRGPVRHFMELVCVGLSKNPYCTVPEKYAHIMWFKEYFESKENLLREVGALVEPIPEEKS